MGNPALPEPVQNEEFCNRLKIAGTGTIDIGVSVVDKRLALEYYNTLSGDGDFEYDSSQASSESAANLQTQIDNVTRPANLLDTAKMTYSGKTPLVGYKHIKSSAFYGGIGAEIQEMFSVTEMEKDQSTFFSSTDPAEYIEDQVKKAQMEEASPAHLVGSQTKMSFNGTWETNARWHKMFYKDVKIHESFSGQFDVEKTLKFHENAVAEESDRQCDGIDC